MENEQRTGVVIMTRTGPAHASDERSSVVVGIDGSDTARSALETAVSMAARDGSSVVAVHAVGLVEEVAGTHVPTFGHRDEIDDAVRTWCAGLDDVPIEHRLEEGPPVDVLLRIARAIDAAAIVIGRRGIGGRPDLLLGSTAHQIVERADRPVLVVPPPGRG
jgi:nucleotide-binding universal stress UspA family protein